MPTAAKIKTISYHALSRARTTIEDFVLSYFPLHGLSCKHDFFRYWDILVFVEASIYEIDEENEALSQAGGENPEHNFQGEEVLSEVLQEKGLLTERIVEQLAKGKEYWRNERRLCSCMLQASVAPHDAPSFTLVDVHQTSEAKSFDYRVLHLLLSQLTGQPVNEDLLAFLFLDENLVDMGDDLVDYEDDVEANSFNIFRAYVHLFKDKAELQLVKRISDFEKRHRDALARLPQIIQDSFNGRRKEASAVAGSEKWKFPRPIYDEQRFRSEVAQYAK